MAPPATSPESLTLRRAGPDDARRLFDWRNDAETRRQSLTDAPVPWDTHAAWFARCLEDPDRCLLIAEVGGRAVGSVRRDADGRLSWQVAPAARGRGHASRMLVAAMAHPDIAGRPLWAEIRPANTASRRAAAAAGLVCVEETPDLTLWRPTAPPPTVPPGPARSR